MSTLTSTATKWVIDPSHSEISFKAKHLVITTVTGNFGEFAGTVETESKDFRGAKIEFTAKVDSLSTGNEGRDGHLKSADFFDVEKFPELKFTSTDFVKLSDDKYELSGDLTIKDVTKRVKLDAEFAGIHKDPFYGKTKAGFEINGKILRKDFGLQWDVITEAGGAVVSNEIRLHINVQLDRIDE